MHIKYESNCRHINRVDEIKIYTFIFFVIIIVIKDYVKISSFHSFNNIHKHISFIPQ